MKYKKINNNLYYKLIIFYDVCAKFNVLSKTKFKIFLIMFKNMILNYYYANFNAVETSIILVNACETMKIYFENAEHKKNVLTK